MSERGAKGPIETDFIPHREEEPARLLEINGRQFCAATTLEAMDWIATSAKAAVVLTARPAPLSPSIACWKCQIQGPGWAEKYTGYGESPFEALAKAVAEWPKGGVQ